MNLTIPTRNDPIARFAVFALLALALYASFAPARPDVQAQDIIIMATPTPALPTPALALDPAIVFSLPTPLPAPEWPTTAQEPFSGTEASGGGDYIAAPTPDMAAMHAESIEVLNDPAQNGGSIAPAGCPFPIINGVCANGLLAKDIPDSDPVFGSKSTADPGPAPTHGGKARPMPGAVGER